MTHDQRPSVFGPHHTTHIKYPDLNLLARLGYGPGQCVILPVTDSQMRYEPAPLIDDKSVIVHSGRDTHEETAIYSVDKATGKYSADHVEMAIDLHGPSHKPDLELVLEDVELVNSCEGETVLSMALYRVGDKTGMLLQRKTTLYGRNGNSRKLRAALYTIPLHEFESTGSHAAWLLNAKDVLRRRSDIAVLHHYHIMIVHAPPGFVVADVATVWKDKRLPPYQQLEGSVASRTTVRASFRSTDMTCFTCSFEFDSSEHAPLKLFCCDKIVCRYCISNCSAATGASTTCPFCRNPFYSDMQQIWLNFGTFGKAYNKHSSGNDQFDAWETFKRTCADLDKELAENNRAEITVDSSLLFKIWSHIANGSELEPTSSTPYRLQPVRSSDFALVNCQMLAIFKGYNGSSIPTDLLHMRTIRDLTHFLFKQFLRARLHVNLTHPQLLNLGGNPTLRGLGLPPGFEEFVKRVLNRTLQF